jgi:hypothetical protein
MKELKRQARNSQILGSLVLISQQLASILFLIKFKNVETGNTQRLGFLFSVECWRNFL